MARPLGIGDPSGRASWLSFQAGMGGNEDRSLPRVILFQQRVQRQAPAQRVAEQGTPLATENFALGLGIQGLSNPVTAAYLIVSNGIVAPLLMAISSLSR